MDEDLLRELHKLRKDARLSDPEYAGPETLRGRVKMWERSNLPGTSAGVRVNSWSDHFGEDWLNVRLGDETLERWFFRAQSDCASDLSSWVAAREEALWGLAGLHWNTVQSELVDRAFSVLAALWEWKKTPESTAPTGGTENELLEAERRRVEGQYWPDMRTRNEWVAGRAGKACVPGEMVDARVAVGWETEFRDEWLSNRLLRIPGVDAHVAEFAVNGLMLIVTQKERQIFLRNRKVEERQSALLDEDLLLNGELLEQIDYVTCGGG